MNNRLPLVIIGVVGLIVGGVVGAVALGGDTSTETLPPEVVTSVQTRTKTVGKGQAAPAKTVTRTKTVTRASSPSVPPGELGSDTSGGKKETVSGTRTFHGKGTKPLGTLTLKKNSTLNWTNSGKVFSVISQTQIHVSSTKKKGTAKFFKGSYENFRVAAIGTWTLTFTPR
jgi:hypothetical protein